MLFGFFVFGIRMADLMLIDMLDQYDQRVVETKDQTETVFSKSHMSTLLKELRKSKVCNL